MTIYVANLHYGVKPEELQTVFENYGEVESVKIISDKFTGKSKGFAFVEMPNAEQGAKAISELNSFELKGRNLVVNEARPKEERPKSNFNKRY
ncbi:MAG TPA: RNA-binding protein [Chitinophagales bacterium]|nr:RNA-binding protein [Chitinophagales bacterium]HNL83975.1 RNA-binding protein [Chitinophagales bacterium]